MRSISLLLLLLCGSARAADEVCQFMVSAPAPLPRGVLPLCGNGVLDAGETCDDGNRVDGDGCSSWCSTFDRFARPCTLAGVNAACPTAARSGYTSSPSNARFCALSSVDASPDGEYVVLADGGLLYRLDLRVDDQSQSVRALQATLDERYTRFCAVRVLRATGEVLAHECASQRLLLLSADGARVEWWVDLLLPPAQQQQQQQSLLLLEEERVVVVAGGNAVVLMVHLDTQEVREVQRVPLVAYNARVYNAQGVLEVREAYSLQGMQVRQVLRGPCLADMAVTQCYVLSMTRADMTSATVYAPSDGGADLAYVVSTDQMLGALGPSFSRGMYTGRGNCIQAQDPTVLEGGLRPRAVTTGSGCAHWLHGWRCAQPLNLAFATEITGASQLLPAGFSVLHTHGELQRIFQQAEASTPNVSAPMLYQSMLRHAWSDATPVDWVELPGSGDVLYVTSTTVGYLSTSGSVLLDPQAPGYCRAHDMLACGPGQYGSAGGTCRQCGESDGTVAHQVACAYAAAQGRAPYAQLSYVGDGGLTREEVDLGLCLYRQMRGAAVDCATPNASLLSPPQPVTMEQDANTTTFAWVQAVADETGLVSVPTEAEHVFEWNSEDTSILYAAAAQGGNLSHPAVAACLQWSGFSLLHHWLPCVVVQLRTQRQGRRLLQSSSTTKSVGGQRSGGGTLTSDTLVTYKQGAKPQPPVAALVSSPKDEARLQVWEIALIVGAGLLVLVFLAWFLLYGRRNKRHLP